MFPKVRGKETTTLPFVVIAFLALLQRFLFAGNDIMGMSNVPVMTALEFAGAFVPIIGAWQVREFIAKNKEGNNA